MLYKYASTLEITTLWGQSDCYKEINFFQVSNLSLLNWPSMASQINIQFIATRTLSGVWSPLPSERGVTGSYADQGADSSLVTPV